LTVSLLPLPIPMRPSGSLEVQLQS
jgi:hypothetical protein